MRHVIGWMLAITLALGLWLLLARNEDSPPPTATDTATNQTPGDADAVAADASPGHASATDATLVHDERTTATTGTAAPAPCVRVHVFDADKHAIEGATIETFDDSTPGTVTTDAKGWATLAIPPGHGDLRMLVRADHRHLQRNWQRSRELTITLPWTGAVRGRLVDQLTGAPIADAEVTRSHGSCRNCDPDRARTAADGSFELPAVPRDEDCYFTFAANDYPRQASGLRIPGRGEALEHTFRLLRGELIAGHCVDFETHRPVADAKVSLGGGEALATTAIDGAFRLLVLPGGDHRASLHFEAPGYCNTDHSVATPQADGAVEYVIVRAVSIRGRVHSPAGTPIVGAGLRTNRWSNESPAGLPAGVQVSESEEITTVKSAADGTFCIPGLVPGMTYRVAAWHADYQRVTGPDRWGIEAKADAGAPPIDIVLEPKAGLTGGGTILGHYRLNGEAESAWMTWRAAGRNERAAIADDGTFRVEHVPAGTVKLIVTADRFQSWGNETEALQLQRDVTLHEGEELQVELEQTIELAAITGHVTAADGGPAIDQRVAAYGENRQGFHAETDERGDYSMMVPTCMPTVTVTCGTSNKKNVQPGSSGIDFELKPATRLLLRVQSDDGVLLEPSIAMRAAGAKYFQQNRHTAPDPQGYREVGIAPGAYTLAVSASNFAPSIQNVTVGDQTRLEVTLVSGTTVRVRLAEGATAPEGRNSCGLADSELVDPDQNQGWMMGLRVERWFALTRDGTTLLHVAPGHHKIVGDASIDIVPDSVDVGTSPVTVEVTWHRRAK